MAAHGCSRSDFPIVCASCLGDNPYLRMSRAPHNKECKICSRPFSVFRWKPGRHARYKNTEICPICTKVKNICQVCLLDLDYGLPVQVRDYAMGLNTMDAVPRSDVNRVHFAEVYDRRARAGLDYNSSYRNVRAGDTILKLQKTSPHYKRNLPKVCTFYAFGNCKRGAYCPFLHEMPVTGELSRQNIKDRYYGVNDPVASKFLRKAEEMASLKPPEDEAVRTLYVGGLDQRITEDDINDYFYAFGELESIRLVSDKACVFVTYTTREAAERAVETWANELVIKGLRLKLMWARPLVPEDGDEAAEQRSIGLVSHSVPMQTAVSEYAAHINPPPSLPTRHPFYPSMDPRRMGSALVTQDHGTQPFWLR